ncbi:type II toxin-antitoxin system prevent-host-death family antitoxin [Candidatus Saccharibacteria bacterium]|nr:type II toxin-antitoxin system prevent-host-death family antitoxin [Candidatus Saccharibacteria bacterium]
MKTVTIHDAKTNLSKYIAAAKRGEKIYIGSFGKPEVVLSIAEKPVQRKSRRDFTKLRGLATASDDAFSEEFEAEIARTMLTDL